MEWLGAVSISPALMRRLPLIPRPTTPKQMRELQEWFGVEEKIPAVHIESREIARI